MKLQIKRYMQQLLAGVQHCHERGILHRDLKGSNLLIDKTGVLKIADFGLANFIHPKQKRPLTSRVVTLWYRAPELLLGSTDYGVGIDLWSVGCLLAEMFVGRPIMPGRTEVPLHSCPTTNLRIYPLFFWVLYLSKITGVFGFDQKLELFINIARQPSYKCLVLKRKKIYVKAFLHTGGAATQDFQAVRVSLRGLLEKAEASDKLQASPTVQAQFPRRVQGFSLLFVRSLDLASRPGPCLPRQRRHRS